MSQKDRQIKASNQLLRELDAVYPGVTPPNGKFQWCWSDSLVSLVPEYRVSDAENWDPQPVMEYRCMCGIDKQVHMPECSGIQVAKVKLNKVNTCGLEGEFPTYHHMWLLCVWMAPPSEEAWIDSMGTNEDYPRDGRYVPVHRGSMCVAIPPKTPASDYVRATQVVVSMMRENILQWKAQFKADLERKLSLQVPIMDSKGNVIRDADKSSKYHTWKDRLADKMRKFNPAGTVGYTKESSDGGNTSTVSL